MNASEGEIHREFICYRRADGDHYNLSINSSANNSVPQDIASALFYMSDHLPVSLDFTLGGTVGLNSSYTNRI